jgi:spermidine synthase
VLVRTIFVCLFFASGLAALLYQVIWQRLLTFTTGADIQAVTIVIAAFMVGLGLGSLAGGVVADRLDDRRRLWAFAGCELAIAMFALVSAPLFYDVIYVRLGSWDLPAVLLGSLSFLATLWPTFFMGMSLPLAARIVTADARQPAAWVPILYGWNTLGAAAGALLAVAVLFRRMDFTSILWIGASLNATFGLVAIVLARRVRAASAGTESTTTPATGEKAPASDAADRALMPRLGYWIAAYALSGFIALSLEVLWFRILGIVLKSTALTFGLLLSMYLTGLGVGSLAARTAWARRLPAAASFLLLQAAIPIWAAVTLAGLVMVAGSSWAAPLSVYLGGHSGRPWAEFFTPVFLTVNLVIPGVLMGPPTFFMGLSFGSLQRAVQTDLNDLGRRVGWLQAANIFGAVIGALLTGFLLLDRLGTAGTMALLAALGGVFFWLLLRPTPVASARASRRVVPRAAAVVLLATAVLVVPPGRVLWSRLHGEAQGDAVFAEDGTGLALFKPEPDSGGMHVFANGLGQSRLPWGGVHTALGALPVLVHPRPERIAVIGLGSGDTTFAIGGRPETVRIDSIEIVAAALGSLRRLADEQPYPGVRELLRDPRVTHHLTDGRAFLLRTTDRYDIIEADALRPSSAYAGNLYSVEYFRLLRSRLKPGGFAVSWTPTPRSLNSLVAAFPHVLVVGQIGFGSEMPVRFDVAEIRARIDAPATVAYYRAAGLDLHQQLADYLTEQPRVFGPTDSRAAFGDLNYDLFPKDEFRKR